MSDVGDSYGEEFKSGGFEPEEGSDTTTGEGVSVDYDGDGFAETAFTDMTGDGVADAVETTGLDGSVLLEGDLDGTGSWETVALDAEGDGRYEEVATDLEGDGVLDVSQTDLDGDGFYEGMSVPGADLTIDPATGLVVPPDAMGMPEPAPPPAPEVPTVDEVPVVTEPVDVEVAVEETVVDEQAIADLIDDLLPDEDTDAEPAPVADVPVTEPVVEPEPAPEPAPAPPEGDTVFGDPDAESSYWFQQADGQNTCGPSSLTQIVAEFTGQPMLDESVLTQQASDMGLLQYDANGTMVGMYMQDTETLLEANGVPATVSSGTTQDLANYVESGHDVMLFVDAYEIWDQADNDDTDGGAAPNHFLLVTGIDFENGVAYLSDTGTPDGNMSQVPLSVLEDAWGDSGNQMLVTDAPAAGAAGGADRLDDGQPDLISPDSKGVVLVPVRVSNPVPAA